jgi:glycosyltransferase involved in cell wall biosynthesis
MEAMVKEGHQVYLLTQTPEGPYHETCKKLGVITAAAPVKPTSLFTGSLAHAGYLSKFCKANKIDVVFAHLEKAGLAAVLAQYLMKSRVVVCRHIVDEAYLFNNKNFIRLNKIVYRLAKNVIVVSKRSKEFMIEKEKIDPKKIHVVNLAYNFDLYDQPNTATIKELRKKYACELLLITVCRLVKAKRPHISIEVLGNLIKSGFNAKLIILGSGPEEHSLRDQIANEKLSDHVFLEGQRNNVMDYLSAADVLLHPSVLDSSSVIIKEAGLMKKPVIACKDVGDVNDYLVNGQNALLVQRDEPEQQMAEALKFLLKNNLSARLGEKLHEDVLKRFSINNIIRDYDIFLNS